ncbi:hypothetical protein ACFWYW_36075 [Nonomuraea sp. NPDC059023]
MPHVLAAIGPESLGELLTEIALEHWPAAAIGDVLPALHVLDPDDADEPQVAIALDRAGSWTGLLALTSRELMDQPFIQARPVLNMLFSAVLVRLAPSPRPAPAPRRTPRPVVEPVAEPVAEPTAEPVAVVVAVAEPVAKEPQDTEGPQSAEGAQGAEGPRDTEGPQDADEPQDATEGAEAAQEAEEPQEAAEHREEAAGDEPVAVDQAEEPEPEPGEPEAQEPVAVAVEEEAEAGEPEAADSEEPVAEVEQEAAEEPAEAEAEEPAEADEAEEPDEAEGADGGPVKEGSGPRLPALIESAFADLDDKSWAVAQNRVFTDQPSAVEQLAKLFAVSPAEINATEIALRSRLERWLASDEAAPYRAHLDELRGTIGEAAPRDQLIGAADWHAREIRALEVPAWQFVKATLAGAATAQAVQAAPAPGSAGGSTEAPPVASPFEAAGSGAAEEQVRFGAFTPHESDDQNGEHAAKPYQPLKDVSQTRRCFRQPDGRWYLRVDVTGEHLGGSECLLPTGFAAYLGLSPGESRMVRSAAGELTMSWHGRPVLESVSRLLLDVGAKEGGHVFLTLSDEGVLRARHLPVAAPSADKITRALRLVCYTAPDAGLEVAARVIATRIGMTGPVALPDVLARLRERGDRDLLDLLD